MNSKLFSIIFVVFTIIMAACTPTTADSHDDHAELTLPEIHEVELADGEKLNVVATTSIIGDVVSKIGGEHISLTTLMAPGQDPHSYEATPQDVAAIESAHIVFVNGLDLEEGLMDIIENTTTGIIVPVSSGLEANVDGEEHDDHDGEEQDDHDAEEHDDHDSEEQHDHDGEEQEDHDGHDHSAGDPHFWVDPNNVIIWVENIHHVLSAADPANAAYYDGTNAAYLVELLDLDDFIREQINSIPAENRKLVTDHETFHYYAERYGLEVIGTVIPSASTTGGPSAAEAAALVELLETEGVSAIFVGTTSTEALTDLVTSIAEETGVKIEIYALLTGSLAPDGEFGETYLDYLRFNTSQIVEGLGK